MAGTEHGAQREQWIPVGNGVIRLVSRETLSCTGSNTIGTVVYLTASYMARMHGSCSQLCSQAKLTKRPAIKNNCREWVIAEKKQILAVANLFFAWVRGCLRTTSTMAWPAFRKAWPCHAIAEKSGNRTPPFPSPWPATGGSGPFGEIGNPLEDGQTSPGPSARTNGTGFPSAFLVLAGHPWGGLKQGHAQYPHKRKGQECHCCHSRHRQNYMSCYRTEWLTF